MDERKPGASAQAEVQMLEPEWMRERQVSAEQSVLGSILIEPRCLDEVRQAVSPDLFLSDTNRAMFRAACDLQDEGRTVDPITILEKEPEVPKKYLLELMDLTPTAANVAAYLAVMKEQALRRGLLLELTERRNALLNGGEAREVATDLLGTMEALVEGEVKEGLVPSSQVAVDMLNEIMEIQEGRRIPSVRTGYSSLDNLLEGGFQRNGFYVLAARPGKGKTTMALNIAHRVARLGKRILFISLEMDREQLMARLVSMDLGRMGAAQILNGRFPSEAWNEVNASSLKISKLPIEYNRKDSLNVREIQFLAKLSRAELVVIDYLGLIDQENDQNKRYEEITKISNRLKKMARSSGSPVLCLAQLNRESEKRQNKRPQLADLRDTGAIEQDADGVIFCWPQELEDQEEERKRQMTPMTLIVAKNRHGAIGDIELNWYKRNGRVLEPKTERSYS